MRRMQREQRRNVLVQPRGAEEAVTVGGHSIWTEICQPSGIYSQKTKCTKTQSLLSVAFCYCWLVRFKVVGGHELSVQELDFCP